MAFFRMRLAEGAKTSVRRPNASRVNVGSRARGRTRASSDGSPLCLEASRGRHPGCSHRVPERGDHLRPEINRRLRAETLDAHLHSLLVPGVSDHQRGLARPARRYQSFAVTVATAGSRLSNVASAVRSDSRRDPCRPVTRIRWAARLPCRTISAGCTVIASTDGPLGAGVGERECNDRAAHRQRDER